MIKNIKILSRKEVEYFIKSITMPVELPWAFISIWNSHELVHVFTRDILKKIGCNEALSIRLADLTKDEFFLHLSEDEKKNNKLFDETDAKQIISFVDKINSLDIPTLIIHCAAGISRSGAVGLFTCRYLKLNEDEFRKENENILPNFYILKTLNDVSGIDKDYVKFWETKENLLKYDAMLKFKIF